MSNKNDDEYITEVKGTYYNGKVDLKITRRKRVVIPAALVLFIMFVIFLVTNPAFTLFIVSLPLMLVSLIVLIVGQEYKQEITVYIFRNIARQLCTNCNCSLITRNNNWVCFNSY